MTTTKEFLHFAQGASSGTTGRQRINEGKFLDVKIPLPSLKQQRKMIKDIVDLKDNIISLENEKNIELKDFEKRIFNEA